MKIVDRLLYIGIGGCIVGYFLYNNDPSIRYLFRKVTEEINKNPQAQVDKPFKDPVNLNIINSTPTPVVLSSGVVIISTPNIDVKPNQQVVEVVTATSEPRIQTNNNLGAVQIVENNGLKSNEYSNIFYILKLQPSGLDPSESSNSCKQKYGNAPLCDNLVMYNYDGAQFAAAYDEGDGITLLFQGPAEVGNFSHRSKLSEDEVNLIVDEILTSGLTNEIKLNLYYQVQQARSYGSGYLVTLSDGLLYIQKN